MAQKEFQIAFDGTPVDQDFRADIVLLQVEENTSIANTFRLQLATKLADDGTWNHLNDGFAVFTKVSIKIGFTGGGGLAGALGALGAALGGGGNDGLVPVFDGFVTSVNLEVASEPGNSRIEVSGMDTSVLMSLEEKIATWKDMSDSDIVKQIVNGVYHVPVQADSTPTVHQENDTTIVQRGSDIQFVRQLALRNGLEFYFETDQDSGAVTAYFRAPQLSGTPQPDLAIQLRDQSNLRSFAAQLTGQRPLAVKIEQINVTQNSANIAQVSEPQLNKLGANDADALIARPLRSLVTPKDAQAQMLVLGSPTSDATEMQTIAQAVRDEASWFITARGEINGEAYQSVLQPHRLVLVKGAGNAYSGKYYVTSVVHQFSGDGTYTQSFEARRNARDVDGSEQFGGGGLGLPIPGI
jgi:phage protein D